MASADFCGLTRCITARRAVWPDGSGPIRSLEIGPLDLAPGSFGYGTTRPSLPSEPHRQGAQISRGKNANCRCTSAAFTVGCVPVGFAGSRPCWAHTVRKDCFLSRVSPLGAGAGHKRRSVCACRGAGPVAQRSLQGRRRRFGGVIAAGAVFLPRHRSAGSWRHRDKHSPPSCPCLSRSWSCPRKRPSCFGCPGRGRWSCQTASSAPAL